MPKKTPFSHIHNRLGAKLTDFGGFEMPVQYESIREEHRAVRNSAGIFDISHMGEIFIKGPDAPVLVQVLTINDITTLKEGQAQYSAMCYEDGGIVDDLLVYKMEDDEGFMLVVNASNIEKDLEWIVKNNSFEAEVTDRSADICLLAVQGPESVGILQELTDLKLGEIKRYTFKTGRLAGFAGVMFSATGYTGEKGFEIYFDRNKSEPEAIWNAIMKAGSIQPCGLGARDSLRLEMGFALYGNDITRDTNPLEAGLGWLTRLDKAGFIGRTALKQVQEQGLKRKLTGFITDDRRAIPRPGYKIYDDKDTEIGKVTSGSQSVTLEKGIGLGYVDIEFVEEGTKIFIEIRNNKAEATVTDPPFVETE